MAKNLITTEGKRKLQEELELKTKELSRAINDLTDARDRGGVDENTEYYVAKEIYENLQSRISKIRQMISNSTVISKSNVDTSKVSVLSSVKILNCQSNKEQTFTIVPENESNPKEGKISSNSPVGTGLFGKVIGDICDISTPVGVLQFKIMDIFIK
jgi:transcription elongation factor GreA